MSLREILNSYPILRPAKYVAKAAFEALYGLSGEDKWLHLLAHRSATPIAVVLDVGSSGGHYLGKAARFLPRAEYHHFEPRPEAADRVEAFSRRLGTNSIVHRVALSDQSGIADFAIMNYGDASSLLLSQRGITKSIERTISVPTERLDRVVQHGHKPAVPIGLLKIDVEGAEANVLKGAPETLSRVASLQIEITPLRHAGGRRETMEIFQIIFDAGLDLLDTTEGNYFFSRDPGILETYGVRGVGAAT